MPKHTYNTHTRTPFFSPSLPSSHRVNCPSVSAFWFLIFKYLPYAINSSSGGRGGRGVADVHQCFVAIDAPYAMPGTYCACVCVCALQGFAFFPHFGRNFFIENKFLTILFGLTENWQLPQRRQTGGVSAPTNCACNQNMQIVFGLFKRASERARSNKRKIWKFSMLN